MMKLNKVNTVSFKARIIDSHAHIGHWQGRNYPTGMLEEFIKSPIAVEISGKESSDTIEKIIVSNLSCIGEEGILDEVKGNEQLLQAIKEKPKYAPLAVCQPNITKGNTEKIQELLKTYSDNFVGFKFHPDGLPLKADNAWYDSYLAIAEKRNMPCLFHCQDGNSAPDVIYELAKRHKNVPIILGHTGAGGKVNCNKAIDVMIQSLNKKDAFLFCDISWVDWGAEGLPNENKESLLRLIKELKRKNALDRILFGTDASLGCFGEDLKGNLTAKQAYEKTVSTIKTMINKNFGSEAEAITEKIFYQNAEDLFFNKTWIKKTKSSFQRLPLAETAGKISKTKMFSFIAGAVVLIAAVFYLIKNNIISLKSFINK